MITATKYRSGHEGSFGFKNRIKEKRSFETPEEAWAWVKQEKRYDQMADKTEGFSYEVLDMETGKPVVEPTKLSTVSSEENKKFKVVADVLSWGVPVETGKDGNILRKRVKETPSGLTNPLVFNVLAKNKTEAVSKLRKHVETMEPKPYFGKIEITEKEENLLEDNMNEKVFEVSLKDIEWDIDGYEETDQALSLPNDSVLKVLAFDKKDAVQVAIDRLTDDYGFLINQAKVINVQEKNDEIPKLDTNQLKEMIVKFMKESLQEAEADRKTVDDKGNEVNTDNIAFEPNKKTRPGTLKDVAFDLGIITDKEKPFTVEDLDELEALGGKTAKRAIYAKAFLPVQKLKPKKVCK